MHYPYYFESEEMKALVSEGKAALVGTLSGFYEVYQVGERVYREHTVLQKPFYRFYLTEEWYGKQLLKEIEETKNETTLSRERCDPQ